jgi:hypothetical protein
MPGEFSNVRSISIAGYVFNHRPSKKVAASWDGVYV